MLHFVVFRHLGCFQSCPVPRSVGSLCTFPRLFLPLFSVNAGALLSLRVLVLPPFKRKKGDHFTDPPALCYLLVVLRGGSRFATGQWRAALGSRSTTCDSVFAVRRDGLRVEHSGRFFRAHKGFAGSSLFWLQAERLFFGAALKAFCFLPVCSVVNSCWGLSSVVVEEFHLSKTFLCPWAYPYKIFGTQHHFILRYVILRY